MIKWQSEQYLDKNQLIARDVTVWGEETQAMKP